MRLQYALAVALFASSPVFAQIRTVAELPAPASPAISPVGGLAPALMMPPPGLPISAPSLLITPFTAAPVAAAPPLAANTALILTGSALSAAARESRDQGSVSRQAFDAGAKAPADAPAVAVPAAAETSPRLASSRPHAIITTQRRGGIKDAVVETAGVATVALPFVIASLYMKGMMSNPALLIPSMLALWGSAAWAMRDRLGGLRATVVGGWQASHDQRYRTDYTTGRLTDIRGKKYGEDRYDEWAKGPVGPRAMTVISGAALLAAAAFLLL